MSGRTDIERKRLGEWGEMVAEKYLKREKDFKVWQRNYRNGRGEIDLIMRRKDVLVFVEVRTRRGDPSPLNLFWSISKHKRKVLRRTSLAFMRENDLGKINTVRFDIIGIVGDGKKAETILHWENIRIFGHEFR